MSDDTTSSRQAVLRTATERINRQSLSFFFPLDEIGSSTSTRTTTRRPQSLLMRLFQQHEADSLQNNEKVTTTKTSGIAADKLMDIAYTCKDAMRKCPNFPSEIWTCCTKVCFAAMAMGERPRFFKEVMRIKEETEKIKSRIQTSEEILVGPNQSHSAIRLEINEEFKMHVVANLPFLLGKISKNGIRGQMCISSVRYLFGVSLRYIYKVRNNGDLSTLIDGSDSRSRCFRRTADRRGYPLFSNLLDFKCSCEIHCLKEANADSLQNIYERFCLISKQVKPYENENEFILDMLYDEFYNCDISFCDAVISDVLTVSTARIMRARQVLRRIIENPKQFGSVANITVEHGMYRYRSQHHPMNRISEEIRQSVAECLNVTLRADPSGSGTAVKYRLYDASINTMEKLRNRVYTSLSRSLGDVGELNSVTFKNLFREYLADRDGKFTFARADHNCCPTCQDLEFECHGAQMELKLAEKQLNISNEDMEFKRKMFESAKQKLNKHVKYDKMVRSHLKKLAHAFREEHNKDMEAFRNLVSGVSIEESPAWLSRKGRAVFTHQDDMTKPDVPTFHQDSLSSLARYRPDVTAHVSVLSGDATVTTHEYGSGAKNSGSVFEGILLNHIFTCKGEDVMIVWSDCASVGRSFFSLVACTQFLVDSGFCNIALFGFMANCHGKYLADSLFGQWRTRARRVNIITLDDLIDVFQSINRSGTASVTGLILNPFSSIEWQENLARLGYAVTPPAEFGWEQFNPHYACACNPSSISHLPESVHSLLQPLLPRYEHCVRLVSWPDFDTDRKCVPFEKRPLDVPARQIHKRSPKEIRDGRPDDQFWHMTIPPHQRFSPGGPCVFPKSTAEIVGYNASGYIQQVPILRHSVDIKSRAWPPDFQHGQNSGILKVSPVNWIARRAIQSIFGSHARYPPINYYNAINSRPPTESTDMHRFIQTYQEPLFPVIKGACSNEATQTIDYDRKDLSSTVTVLDLYKELRLKMGVRPSLEVDEYLQPLAKDSCDEARTIYKEYLAEKSFRIEKRPAQKRNPYQLFRKDQALWSGFKLEVNRRKRAKLNGATLAAVSKQYWDQSPSSFKKNTKIWPSSKMSD